MTETIKEYAQAIFELATEKNARGEFLSELTEIKKLFAENPEYIEFLSSFSIPESERIAAVEQAFGGRVSEYVLNFLMLLCKKRRITGFNDCVSEYEALMKFSENICVAKITSAAELSEENKKRICEKLAKATGKEILPEYHVDKSLLGGVIVDAEGKVFDGSLKSRLKEIKEVIDK